ncbi:MAG: hypothetical protein K1Y36_23180 [Blastocatellia bacterium]|nr:hypothetical protein [Blastocatellia bacterium]
MKLKIAGIGILLMVLGVLLAPPKASLSGPTAKLVKPATKAAAPPAVAPARAPQGIDTTSAEYQSWADDKLFEQMSGAKRSVLERKYGKKSTKSEKVLAEEARIQSEVGNVYYGPSNDASLKVAPEVLPTNVLVNNPTADTGTTSGFTQSETAIVLGSGSNVVASFNDSGSNITANNKFTGFSVSTNGGTSFTDNGVLPNSTVGTDGDAGDPVLARSARTGTIFLATLSFNTAQNLWCFRSTDNGASFLSPATNLSPGFTSTTGNQDKEWIAVDNNSTGGQPAGFGNVYHFWRNFGSTPGMTFTRSTDDGLTFGPAPGLILNASGQGAQVAVGVDHAVYCMWFNTSTIALRKSTDQGVTFGSTITVAPVTSTGTNGDLALTGGFRSSAFPALACSPTNANLLAMAFADKGTSPDAADIYFVTSTDGGATWGAKTRLNTDVGNGQQWHPSIAFTPDGTKLMVSWYDRRLTNNVNIDRFGRIANVSGTTFTFGCDFRITQNNFPVLIGGDSIINSTYMGDYDQTVADNSFFYSTFSSNLSGTGLKPPDVLFVKIPVAGPGAVIDAGATSVVAESCTPANNAIDPGENVTVSLALSNSGTSATTNLVATLQASSAVTNPGPAQTYGALNSTCTGGTAVSRNFTFTAGAGLVCGSSFTATLALQDGATNLGTVDFTFRVGAQNTLTFSNTGAITIVDNAAGNPYPSNITVSGVTGAVGRITVTLTGLTHTFPTDIDIIVVGPGGQKAYVMSDVGGTSAPAAPVTLTFDDQAAATIGSSLTSGTFKPSNSDTSTDTFPAPAPATPYATDFTGFNNLSGANVNGTWSLYVRDDVGTDSGSISGGWTLNLITATCSTSCNVANTPPTITAGAAATRQQGSAGTTATIATVSDTETAAGSLTVTTGALPTGITVTGITNTNGTITATVAAACNATVGANTVPLTVTDGGGLTANANFTVNVTANTAPTLGTYPNTTVGVGGGTTVTPSAAPTDNGSVATLTAAVTAGGAFTGTLTGNATTGVITVANANAGGPYTVTVTATDNCGATTTATFTLTVSANTLPTITPVGVTRQQGSAGTVGTIATVSDVETPAGNLTVTATTVPTGITVTGITNTNGTITANVAASCTATVGANTVVLTVTDGSGGSTTGNLIVTVTANTAPVLGTYPNITVNQTQSGTSTPSAAPTDNGSVVSLTAAAPGFTGTLTGNAGTGVVTASNAGPAGTFTCTVTATDNCGATSTATFTITVPANSPPTITPTPITRQQGSAGFLATIATVNDAETPANNLTVAATTVPTGISVTSLSNLFGNVTAIVTASCTATVGANTVVLTVTDGGGLSVTANLIVTVTANTAPTLGTYPNSSVNTGNPLNVTPSAAPSDNGTVATLTVTASSGYTGTLTINAATGIVSLLPTTAGTFTITVTATDNCGATTSTSFTLGTTPFQKGPFITSISPTSGTRGSSVTITGGNFSQVTSVLFNGAAATFTIDSSTQITATVPNTASTGPIVVNAAGGSSATGPTFTVIRTK